MSMKPCQNCLENNWTFNKLDSGDIQATCDHCDYEVEWTPKAKVRKSIKRQTKKDKVKRECCGKPTVLREPKSDRRPKSYYYTAYRFCNTCRKIYYDNKFKVNNRPIY